MNPQMLSTYSDEELVCYLRDSDSIEVRELCTRLSNLRNDTRDLINIDDCPECDESADRAEGLEDQITEAASCFEDLVSVIKNDDKAFINKAIEAVRQKLKT